MHLLGDRGLLVVLDNLDRYDPEVITLLALIAAAEKVDCAHSVHVPADDLAQAKAALQQLLKAHDPMPALVLDAHWNLLQLNRGGEWLAATLMPPEALASSGSPNLLDMLVHPMGMTRPLLNLREAGPAFLSQLRAEAALQPALAPKVEAFGALLRDRLDGRMPPAAHPEIGRAHV